MTNKKVAIVTGGAKGIGRAIATALARDSYRVVIADIDQVSAEEIVKDIIGFNGTALAIKTDVSKRIEVHEMVKVVLSRFGEIDVLINDAGGALFRRRPIEEVAEEEWERVIDVNLKGTFLCCQAVVPQMKERRKGRIVNISSVAGRTQSQVASIDYSSAKAGVLGLTRQLAKEVAPYGIIVNAVCPGVITSERVKEKIESMEDKDEIMGAILLGRAGTVEEIADLVCWLVSSKCSFMTGATIDVNGGKFMG